MIERAAASMSQKRTPGATSLRAASFARRTVSCTSRSFSLGCDKNLPARFLLPLMERGEQRIQHEGGSSVRSDDQPEEALARLDERSGEIVDGTGIAYEHLLETSVREVAPHGFDALFVHGVAPYVVADKVGRVCLLR